MKTDVIAVILSAGIGTRFWPITTPKEQVPFLGQSLIVRNIEKLQRVGFRQVVVVGNPTDESFVKALRIPAMQIQFVVQKEAKGMGDALLSAQKEIAGKAVLVMNAEDLVDDALYTRVAAEIDKGEAFVVGRKIDEYFDGGYLMVKQDRLTGIVEKPGEGNEPSNLANLVYHYFPNATVFTQLIATVSTKADDVYEKALAHYAQANVVRVLPYDGKWLPLKYPWHILDILHELLSTMPAHMGKHLMTKSNVVIEGNVWFGDNVKIFENTKITGPCYIGSNSIIGNNSMIRESFLGEGCITGFNTDITRSYIGENCWFHSNYVGDSVFEGNISMGAGAKTANLRLDEQEITSIIKTKRVKTGRVKLGAIIARNVRVGVNASIMPGIKIGANSFVGSGVILDKDVENDSFCTAKASSYEVKKNTRTVDVESRAQFKKAL